MPTDYATAPPRVRGRSDAGLHRECKNGLMRSWRERARGNLAAARTMWTALTLGRVPVGVARTVAAIVCELVDEAAAWRRCASGVARNYYGPYMRDVRAGRA